MITVRTNVVTPVVLIPELQRIPLRMIVEADVPEIEPRMAVEYLKARKQKQEKAAGIYPVPDADRQRMAINALSRFPQLPSPASGLNRLPARSAARQQF